jgi:hypothetical protein
MDYYNRAGIRIDESQWAALIGDTKYKRIARTTTIFGAADPTTAFDVSTVWLGLDHSFGASPLIFETMVFGDDEMDLDCRRYATETESRKGHTEMVVAVAATVDNPIVMDAVSG